MQIILLISNQECAHGDIGNRTILSQNFTISGSDSGNYHLSIYTKSSIISTNGNIKFSLLNVDTSAEQQIGQVNFANSWSQFTNNSIDLLPGQYKLKILIQDKTTQKVDIYLDNITLEKNWLCK